MDYKAEIDVIVDEATQSISFDTNYFTNLSADPVHIDNSTLTLSDEAKLLDIPEFVFKASYENDKANVFEGMSDETTPDIPTGQTVLATKATQNIKYSTNMTYETAKLLSTIENAFTLELNETPCYTIEYSANEATGGEAPAPVTLTPSAETGALNVETYAPENTGGLVKTGYRFTG